MPLDTCAKTMPKAMDMHIHFQINGLWLPEGKGFVVVWFSAKASFQGHGEPPFYKTTNYKCFPQPHMHSVETSEDSFGKAGWDCAKLWEERFMVYSFPLCFSLLNDLPLLSSP